MAFTALLPSPAAAPSAAVSSRRYARMFSVGTSEDSAPQTPFDSHPTGVHTHGRLQLFIAWLSQSEGRHQTGGGGKTKGDALGEQINRRKTGSRHPLASSSDPPPRTHARRPPASREQHTDAYQRDESTQSTACLPIITVVERERDTRESQRAIAAFRIARPQKPKHTGTSTSSSPHSIPPTNLMLRSHILG